MAASHFYESLNLRMDQSSPKSIFKSKCQIIDKSICAFNPR